MSKSKIQDSAFSERMKLLLETKFGNNNSEFARSVGVAVTSLNRWLDGDADPSRTNLIRLAQAADANIEWLALGLGEPFPQALKIQAATTPEMDEQAAMQSSLDKTAQFIAQQQAVKRKAKLATQRANGLCDTQGNPVDIDDFVFIPYYNVSLSAGHGSWVDNERPTHALAFRLDWLQMFVSTQVEHLSVVKVSGDSMTGVLENNDTILVDHTQTEPRDSIYAIRLGNDVFVKRIQRLTNTRLQIISANTNYLLFEIDLNSTDTDFTVIGKVVWLGRVL